MENKNQITISKPRKPTNQVIVSKLEDKFLIGKRFTRSIAVISPFERVDEVEITTNFQAPNNRSKRIQILYNMIPKISRYCVSEEGVKFDCLESISQSTDIFKNVNNGIDSGFIHFDVTSFKKKDEQSQKPTTFIDINPRLLFARLEEQEMIETKLKNLDHKFKTIKFKAFSVILERGFILCSVDKILTTLYLTINRPNQNFVGNCIKKEVNNITANIFPLWPIFNINMNQNKLGVFVSDDIVKDYKHVSDPILLKIEREVGSDEAVASCIGYNVKID
jgi:hypothetical protein